MNDLVRLLFHEVADLGPVERDKVFTTRNVAPAVRAEIESLLSFDSNDEHALTGCVVHAARDALHSNEPPGPATCGPYQLLRLLGSGGMGSVYLAERADGEIQQKVAIKLLRTGAERPAWQERFLRERQLLAYLNHPSVTRVLDAGRTHDGRPYLVMEYVDGVAIDVYAAGKDLREQLALFLRVCEGIAHAHRHLIIHRDLKPSNILVDASGQPKVLDFGIAKLLDGAGEQTETVERLLTPAYASPEQLRGSNQTTAADVYSLGAVLYKLLTGRSPHESENQTAQTSAVAAGIWKVPVPSRLDSHVPVDLDCILLKALRPEPEERYASVEALANDIRAVLESRPVQARSGNAWYRMRKFLRRYWIPVVAASLAIAGLSGGLWIANRERAIAQRRFEDVRQLANKLFDIDAEARAFSGSTATRQLIVHTALEYLRRLTASVRGDPELALEVGNAYMRVARVQGVPISPNLGQMTEAEQSLRSAERFVQTALKAQPANRTAVLRMAQIAHDRMLLARYNGRRELALPLARQSAEWLRKYNAGPSDRAEKTAILTAYMNVADEYLIGEQFEDALSLCRRATEIARAFDSPAYAGMFTWVTAKVYQRRAEPEEALTKIRESVQLLGPGPSDADRGRTANLVLVLIAESRILGDDGEVNLGRTEEAKAPVERAFQIADGLVHRDPRDQSSRGMLSMAGLTLADLLRQSDPKRALDIYDHMLRHLAEIQNNPSFRRFEVSALAGSSYPLRTMGRAADAKQRLDTAFERLKELTLYPAEKIYPGSEVEETIQALAAYEEETGNLAGALRTYEMLLERRQPAKAGLTPALEDAIGLSSTYRSVARLYRRTGQSELASEVDARRRELWQQWEAKLPHNVFVLRQLGGSIPNGKAGMNPDRQ